VHNTTSDGATQFCNARGVARYSGLGLYTHIDGAMSSKLGIVALVVLRFAIIPLGEIVPDAESRKGKKAAENGDGVMKRMLPLFVCNVGLCRIVERVHLLSLLSRAMDKARKAELAVLIMDTSGCRESADMRSEASWCQ
jgi:hypothetical protein